GAGGNRFGDELFAGSGLAQNEHVLLTDQTLQTQRIVERAGEADPPGLRAQADAGHRAAGDSIELLSAAHGGHEHVLELISPAAGDREAALRNLSRFERAAPPAELEESQGEQQPAQLLALARRLQCRGRRREIRYLSLLECLPGSGVSLLVVVGIAKHPSNG